MDIELSQPELRHTRRHVVETARVIQRYAEHLVADADRVLTRCITGQTDADQIADDLHAIDRSAASIRTMLCGLDASAR